jgi:hypothetical protein
MESDIVDPDKLPDSPGGGTQDPGRDGEGSPSRSRPDSPGGGSHDPRSHRPNFASSEPDSPGGGESDADERDSGRREPDSPGGGEQGREQAPPPDRRP